MLLALLRSGTLRRAALVYSVLYGMLVRASGLCWNVRIRLQDLYGCTDQMCTDELKAVARRASRLPAPKDPPASHPGNPYPRPAPGWRLERSLGNVTTGLLSSSVANINVGASGFTASLGPSLERRGAPRAASSMAPGLGRACSCGPLAG